MALFFFFPLFFFPPPFFPAEKAVSRRLGRKISLSPPLLFFFHGAISPTLVGSPSLAPIYALTPAFPAFPLGDASDGAFFFFFLFFFFSPPCQLGETGSDFRGVPRPLQAGCFPFFFLFLPPPQTGRPGRRHSLPFPWASRWSPAPRGTAFGGGGDKVAGYLFLFFAVTNR